MVLYHKASISGHLSGGRLRRRGSRTSSWASCSVKEPITFWLKMFQKAEDAMLWSRASSDSERRLAVTYPKLYSERSPSTRILVKNVASKLGLLAMPSNSSRIRTKDRKSTRL